jgi:GT2 family glycosyltransferase
MRNMITVIIPHYNDNRRLDYCLQALARQSHVADRILVADNGSEQAPLELCEAYPNVSCILAEKPGAYAARNAALELCSGQYVAFTDSDCIPRQDWLKNALQRFHTDTDVDLIGGKIVVSTSEAPNLTEKFEAIFAFPQRHYIENDGYSVTANLFAKSNIFLATGKFNESLLSGGDRDWCRRAAASGFKLVFDESVVVSHPARTTLSSLFRKTDRTAAGEWASRQSWWPKLQLLLPRIPVNRILLPALRNHDFPLPTRLGFCGIALLLSIRRSFALLAVLFGAEAKRQ